MGTTTTITIKKKSPSPKKLKFLPVSLERFRQSATIVGQVFVCLCVRVAIRQDNVHPLSCRGPGRTGAA